MRLRLMLLAIPLLLASAAPAVQATSHSVDPNPSGKQWVEATFSLTQPSLTDIVLDGELTLRKYTIGGRDYSTSDAIAEYYTNTLPTTQLKETFVADIENTVWSALNDTLEDAFAKPPQVDRPVVDRTTLAVSNGNAFEPGVRITFDATVTRTLGDLGLGDLSADAVEAVFDAGASFATDFDLSAEPGYDVTYVISPPASPAGLAFRDVQADEGVASMQGAALRAVVANAAGTRSAAETVRFTLVNPTAEAAMPDAESIATYVDVTLGGLAKGVASVPLSIEVASEIEAIDVESRFGDTLPAGVTLAFLSASALQSLHDTGAIDDTDLDSAVSGLLSTVESNLGSILPGATVAGGFEEASLHEGGGAVRFTAATSGPYALPEGGENADLALRIGATLNFDLDLTRSKDGATIYTVRTPSDVVFTKADGGVVSDDKRSASFTAPPSASGELLAASLGIRAKDAPTYTKDQADNGASFAATVDLQEIDISISKAIGGDLGSLNGEVLISAKLGVLEVPESFRGSLPGNVELSYLTSDAIRLLRERGVLTDANAADLEKAFRENVTTNLQNALGVPITVTGGIVAASMAPSLVDPALSGKDPVVLEARAAFSKPLAGAAPPAQAATVLYSMPQSFTLPSVQGLSTTYKVILPPGLALSDFTVSGGTQETGTEDGRDYFVVTPTKGGEATASMNIGVTPGFVVSKFWPILLLAVLLVFLIVGTPIAIVVMRMRRKKKQA